MADAYVEALREAVPGEHLSAIYAKGSAYKPWDSVIDYVPVVSDVDLHVRFAEDADAERHVGGLRAARALARRALEHYQTRFPDASHVPRPQLTVLNEIERQPGYLPSPEGQLHTLHGSPAEGASREAYASAGTTDAERLAADARFVREELPGKLIDRPGMHAWRDVRMLAWRVGPSGPRVLTQRGMHPHDAWCLNRTAVVRALEARGAAELAEAYAAYYLACWDGYRAGFGDAASAERALDAVERLFLEAGTPSGRQPDM